MATTKQHRKPAVPRAAEKVARQMYQALTAEGAPRATPTGYIMGAAMVFKMLIEQAAQQGGDKESLKAQALAYIQVI